MIRETPSRLAGWLAGWLAGGSRDRPARRFFSHAFFGRVSPNFRPCECLLQGEMARIFTFLNIGCVLSWLAFFLRLRGQACRRAPQRVRAGRAPAFPRRDGCRGDRGEREGAAGPREALFGREGLRQVPRRPRAPRHPTRACARAPARARPRPRRCRSAMFGADASARTALRPSTLPLFP